MLVHKSFFWNKRALSNVVAYALLIVMTIALSTIIFSWLQGYVGENEVIECPSGVDISIKAFSCSATSMDLTLKNMGRFDIYGYVVRVDDKPNSESGFYKVAEGDFDSPLQAETSEEAQLTLDSPDFSSVDGGLSNVTLVEVQPRYFDEDKGKRVSCRSSAIQRINCLS